VRPELVFTAAREVLKDNRISPKENRRVEFSFPLGAARPAAARVALVYEIPTPDIAPGARSIDLPVAEVVVRAREDRTAPVLLLAGLAAAAALLAAGLRAARRRRATGA